MSAPVFDHVIPAAVLRRKAIAPAKTVLRPRATFVPIWPAPGVLVEATPLALVEAALALLFMPTLDHLRVRPSLKLSHASLVRLYVPIALRER